MAPGTALAPLIAGHAGHEIGQRADICAARGVGTAAEPAPGVGESKSPHHRRKAAITQSDLTVCADVDLGCGEPAMRQARPVERAQAILDAMRNVSNLGGRQRGDFQQALERDARCRLRADQYIVLLSLGNVDYRHQGGMANPSHAPKRHQELVSTSIRRTQALDNELLASLGMNDRAACDGLPALRLPQRPSRGTHANNIR